MVDLVGGQLDLIFALLPECAPHIKGGKLRALATTTQARHALIPDVPTTAEAGLPELVVTSWNGFMAPSSTPRAIVEKINADVRALMAAPALRRRIVEQGFEPASLSVSEAEKFVSADVARWSKVVREANIRAELYLGESGMKAQMKYADKRGSPLVVIQGGDEKARGEVQIKDLRLGAELASNIQSREEYASQRLAQFSVPESGLIAAVKKALNRQ